MSMKKIIASAAAAALTVSSLAVVGVSAEATTKTFNFVGKTGKMKISYTQTASFLGGVEPHDLFTQADPNYTFDYALSLSLADGYKTDNLDAVNGQLLLPVPTFRTEPLPLRLRLVPVSGELTEKLSGIMKASE